MQSQNQATGFIQSFQPTSHHSDELETRIALARKSLDNEFLLTDGELAEALEILANNLCTRFDRRGEINDIEESIHLLRQAVPLRPMDHDNHPRSLMYLAKSLFWRYRRELSGQYDLDEAILLMRKAIELLPVTHVEFPGFLFLLVFLLTERFRALGEKEDAKACMPLYWKARIHPQSCILDSSWPGLLDKLSGSLLIRYSMSDDEEILDQSISVRREVLKLLPPIDPRLPQQIQILAVTLNIRYKKRGQRRSADLDEMISCYRQHVEFQSIPPQDLRKSRDELATLLETRFQETDNQSDINESISIRRKLLELTPAGHPDREKVLTSLAWVLYLRFTDTTNPKPNRKKLNEAIALWRESLNTTSPVDQSTALANLATGLDTRFDRIGDKKDYEEAMSLYRRAMALPIPLSSQWTMLLKNFAFTLVRFDDDRSKADVEQAIWLARESLRLYDDIGSSYALPEHLNQLGYALLVQIEDSNAEEGDLEECISLHRRALSLRTPEDPYYIGSLRNLAVSLHWRFKKFGQKDNLEESISLFRQGKLQDDENIDILRRLADALETRFNLNNLAYQSDFQEIVSLRKDADELEEENTDDEDDEDEDSDDEESESDDGMDM
ncbi:hypothetical protein JR316_0002710 [Psilocybe cubensis]|uniref:Uncharacterized protein n=2 Tax=Psilocybe cubensis TaxID=181762 RepID=A0ACB8HF73_PSICU|nr:hypothetical protein JR316_0002710 [Psilocybe cubensis]KAH9485795.1 hypothetical protein JR316_0002710 [Psilocybe cubensis]